MMLSWSRIQAIIDRHRIIYGVIGALLIASLLTAISMALYVSSGASRLDLSRPGYERVRSDVQRDSARDTFSSTGPMNSTVAEDFQERFTNHREVLQNLDTYGTNALDDNQLLIAPN